VSQDFFTRTINRKCIHCGVTVLLLNPGECIPDHSHDYRAPLLVKRSALDTLVQGVWEMWANGKQGLGPPVMLALERAVEMAGAEIEEDIAP
jgi:hypothetical protein